MDEAVTVSDTPSLQLGSSEIQIVGLKGWMCGGTKLPIASTPLPTYATPADDGIHDDSWSSPWRWQTGHGSFSWRGEEKTRATYCRQTFYSPAFINWHASKSAPPDNVLLKTLRCRTLTPHSKLCSLCSRIAQEREEPRNHLP